MKIGKALGLLMLCSTTITFSCSSQSDIVIDNFESESFDDWTVEGTAFGTAPVSGMVGVQMEVSGFEGKFFANSFHGGDDSVGTITSSAFTIERNYINYLLGGGRHIGTYIELIIEGISVYQSRPISEGETLQYYTWDVKKYKGKNAQIKVVDNQRGGWGHILVDDIVMSNEAKSDILNNHEMAFRIDKQLLLIPMQDQAPEHTVYLKQGDTTIGEAFTIRIAQTQVDYWIPIDVEKYKGQDIALVFDNVKKSSIGYQQIKQADDYHFDYNETYRPDYHFSPRYGWTNDPNGMVYNNGEYHLFYQHNPFGTMWGNMNWGHAVSKDLKKWEHLPVAIMPDSLGTIFSGSMVVDKNNTAGFGANAMVAIYTSAGQKQTQSIAYSQDNGRTFTKYDKNPVLSDISYPDFRDPKVFWYDAEKKWVMSLATGQTISFYESPNLKEWHKMSEFGKGIGSHNGVWECPDMFPLSDGGKMKWVLLVSINPGGPNGGNATQYFIGNFDGKTFTPDSLPYPLWIDYGRDNYAGVTWDNVPNARRLFIGWMSNWDYANQVPTANFRNAMTIPRELKLTHNGSHAIVASEPIAEMRDLTIERKDIGNISVNGKYSVNKLLDNASGAYELEMTISPAKVDEFSIRLTNRKKEELVFTFDIKGGILSVDRSKSGLIDFSNKFAPMIIKSPINRSGAYKLRLFIDKASSELFVNNGEMVMTNIMFPSEPYNTLLIENDGGSLTIHNLKIYNLK